MTVSQTAVRIAFVAVMLGISGCSSSGDAEYYGYEEEFILPEPDMVPVTPDDRPGKTVDELLGVRMQGVTVKTVQEEEIQQDDMPAYEQSGRFGSKEKVSLRKGLNAPDAKIIYGAKRREDTTVVRGLELKENEKDELIAFSEEEVLADIIAPKADEVKVIEVVSNASEKETPAASIEIVPAKTVEIPVIRKEEAAVQVKPDSPETKPAAEVQVAGPAVPALVLVPAEGGDDDVDMPVSLSVPVSAEQTEAVEASFTPEPLVEPIPQAFILTPPAPAASFDEPMPDGEIRLKAPAGAEEPRFLVSQEIGTVAFVSGKTDLPEAAGALVAEAVDTLKNHPDGRVLLIGYDGSATWKGSASRARKRAEAVAAALREKGVSPAQIKIETEISAPYGEETGRHVEIYIEYE